MPGTRLGPAAVIFNDQQLQSSERKVRWMPGSLATAKYQSDLFNSPGLVLTHHIILLGLSFLPFIAIVFMENPSNT